MPEVIRLWKILDGENLAEIEQARLNLEARLEAWLEKDISILSPNLLVIGRQVETDFGGEIDLLCLDSGGDVIVLELKRDKTPREVTAQLLDYGSWVKDLSNQDITKRADGYLKDFGQDLEQAFQKRFGTKLPDTLNEQHQMLIVATELDSRSERIIHYLSDSYGIGINAATFQYFRDDGGQEYLARTFLIEPEQVEYRSQTQASSKRRPTLTFSQLQEIAERNGIGSLYQTLSEELTQRFDRRRTTQSTINFLSFKDGSESTIVSLNPGESDAEHGMKFQVYIDKLAEYLVMGREEIAKILPPDAQEQPAWNGGPPVLVGFIKGTEEAKRLLSDLDDIAQH